MSVYSIEFGLGIVSQLAASTSQLMQHAPLDGILAGLAEPVARLESEHPEFRETLRPISSLLPPPNTGGDSYSDAPLSLTRGNLARAFRQTGTNLSPYFRELETQLLQVLSAQWEQIIQEDRPTLIPGSPSSDGAEEISQDLIQRQMAETLKVLIGGVIHDANNMLSALIGSSALAEEDRLSLQHLAEKASSYGQAEVGSRYLAALRTLQRNLHGVEGFIDMTVKLVQELRLVAGLSGESSKEPLDLPQLFREGGVIQRVSLTLIDLMRGLQDAGRDLAELNAIAAQYAHLAPQPTQLEGARLRGSIGESLSTLQDMAGLIGDLFGILRSVAERLGPANLHRHLNQRLIAAIMGKGVALTLDLDPDPWMIPGPAVSVWQIGMNLMVNARDAMESGGRMTVKTRRVVLSEKDLSNLKASLVRSTPRTGEYMVLQIRDNGTGISPALLPRIFDLSVSGKKSSGLGLAVTLKIVEEMGGFVAVDTADAGPERGTTFSVYFPRVREAAPAVKSRPRLPAGKEQVLLVDDEGALLRIMKRQLESKGYRVLTALNGDAAVEACREWYADENRPAISLMILDLNMPGLRGAALVSRLREFDPGMSCLFQSGMGGLSGDLREIERSSFVEKPSPADAVIRRMRSLIDGE